MKKIKVFIVMNQDERNGHGGVLWFGVSQEAGIIPLQVFSDKESAEKMASRKGLFKVVEAELRFK